MRKRKRDRHPNGQIIPAWSDHVSKPPARLARDGSGAIASGRSYWGVLGGSRYVGWNLEPGHEPKGSGFAMETDCSPKSLTDRNIPSMALLLLECLERFSSLGFVFVCHHHGLPVRANSSPGTKDGHFAKQRRLQFYSIEPRHVDVWIHMDQVDRCGCRQLHATTILVYSASVQ